MKRNTSPSAAPPLSHCVRLPSPFSFLLLSLVLWNSTCYRLAAWERRHYVVCTCAWYSASSQFHIFSPADVQGKQAGTSSSSRSLMTFWNSVDAAPCVLCSLCHVCLLKYIILLLGTDSDITWARLYLDELSDNCNFVYWLMEMYDKCNDKSEHCWSNYARVLLKKMQCTIHTIYRIINVFTIRT